MATPGMSVKLGQILALVGKVDDSPGGDTPRERLRGFLEENVREIGQVRDYIEECLRSTGEQYSRALQDLVNHLGRFLGFEVEFGRYHGIRGEVGFDGHWSSPAGVHVVVEVKTTETYAIKTSTLVGYVDQLISQQKIANWDAALGLYVVGRPDPEVRQLENTILAEKRTDQLRLASVESLLSLAELMADYDVTHDDVLAVLRPSGPSLDAIVDLLARLTAQPRPEEVRPEDGEEPEGGGLTGEATFWLTPVKPLGGQSAEDAVRTLVGEERVYAFGDRTPGRRHLKPDDWICFYATGKGVVAHAKVASRAEHRSNPKVRDPAKHPWLFKVTEPKLYLEDPVAIDAELRGQLDAFKGRDLGKGWAWFVQATRKVSRVDFEHLTTRSR